MPHKPGHPCGQRGCPNIARAGERYCDEHKKLYKSDYARAHPEHFKLYNNKRWRRYRRMFLAEHPLCVNYAECHNEATVVDHIRNHDGDWDLFWDPDNHQPMCKRCHDTKTATVDGGFGNPRRTKT